MRKSAEFAPDRPIDIYGPAAHTAVLIWHGRGPNRSAVLARLASGIADLGIRVFVPDWDSTAEDGGRADLLRSVKYAREYDTDPALRLIVVGWSLGGTAAASLALNSRRLGLGSVPVVALAGAFQAADPLSGQPFDGLPVSSRNPGTVRLVHGSHDDLVPIEGARDFADKLIEAGWDAALIEVATDHNGIVGMMMIDDGAAIPTYIPAEDQRALDALHTVTEVIGELAVTTPD